MKFLKTLIIFLLLPPAKSEINSESGNDQQRQDKHFLLQRLFNDLLFTTFSSATCLSIS
jgi:hypothetical protein